MDSIVITLVTLLAVGAVLYFVFRSKFQALPGPGARAYLPGGEVLPMLQDNRKILSFLLALRKKYGDVYQLWMGPEDTLVTSFPADVVQAIASTESFDRPKAMYAIFNELVPGSLFTMPRDVHIAARKHLKDSFNFSILEDFHSHMIQATDELRESLAQAASRPPPAGYVNISTLLSITTFRIITNAAFGCDLDRAERLEFAAATTIYTEELMQEFVGYPFRQAMAVFGVRKRLMESKDKVHRLALKLVQQRLDESAKDKAARPQDILDAILTLKDHDLAALVSQTVLFAAAGSHTTNEALSWAVYEICCNPQIQEKIHLELKDVLGDKELEYADVGKLEYLRCVWQEALRLHPPGGFISRTALKDVTLAGSGVKVRKGTHVLSLLAGAQLSSSAWTEPERFMPERWGPDMREGERAPPGTNITFSVGRKNCAGRFLADYEGVLILAQLYKHFDISLACKPEEVVSCTGWVECARSSVDGSDLECGVPVRIQLRQ